jgi:hypothetical protein
MSGCKTCRRIRKGTGESAVTLVLLNEKLFTKEVLCEEADPVRLHCTHTHNRSYLFTYLLTPWSRVLPEKLTGLQQVKKFPAFYGT